MSGRILVAIAGMLLVLVQSPAQAVNLKWLEYSPVRFFTDRDWELARSAADSAIGDAEDGGAVTWRNPESGHYGSVTPVSTLKRDGRRCRELAIENHARGLTGGGIYLFCLQPDGQWKIEAQAGGAPAPGVPAAGAAQ